MGRAMALTSVYALELVGENDAFACYEAAALTTDVRRVAPGIALTSRRPPSPDRLAYTRTISRVVARTTADVERATRALANRSLGHTGTAAVRARSIRGCGIDTQQAERSLGRVLVDQGFSIDLDDPDHTLRALFAGDRAVLGWLVDEPAHGFADRQPTNRPFFQPGSMAPRLALALVNLTGVEQGERLLDPMCGTGGSLIEAGRIGVFPVGLDVQSRMIEGTRTNLAEYGIRGDVIRGDASRLPFDDATMDAVVIDVPYGRQSKIASDDSPTLIADVLGELGRVTSRAILVADRSISRTAREAGWTVRATFAHRVHRSLTRHIHDLHHSG